MRKRIRKKNHLGEFRQMGLSVECHVRPGLSATEFDQFVIAFIEHAIEAHGLTFGGGGSAERGWNGVVTRGHRYDSTTQADQAALQSWLEQRAELVSFRLSGFWDVWRGSNPFDPEIAAPDDAPHRSQPVHPETHRTSAVAGSGL
jgi:uncharacterized protein YggL (DUF469 family)